MGVAWRMGGEGGCAEDWEGRGLRGDVGEKGVALSERGRVRGRGEGLRGVGVEGSCEEECEESG